MQWEKIVLGWPQNPGGYSRAVLVVWPWWTNSWLRMLEEKKNTMLLAIFLTSCTTLGHGQCRIFHWKLFGFVARDSAFITTSLYQHAEWDSLADKLIFALCASLRFVVKYMCCPKWVRIRLWAGALEAFHRCINLTYATLNLYQVMFFCTPREELRNFLSHFVDWKRQCM